MPHSVAAHHSHANIDRSKIERHTGVVSEYSWTMPHVFLKVMAPNPEGEVVEYSIELLHPPGMLQRGWDKDSFRSGDRITWEGPADRDPNRYYSGLNWAERGDGTRLNTQAREEPVEPSTDFTGLWVRDLRGEAPHYTPPRDWPYTALAQIQVDNFNEAQNPALDCIDPGIPKATLLPYPIEISRPNERTILMRYELRDDSRIIHLDDTVPPGPRSPLGHARARFEGEELIVETSHFSADRWGTHTGVDSSEQKHLTERYRLSNGGLSLDVRMTVSDPVYLREPVSFDYHLAKIPDRELIQVPCTRENARLFLEGGLTRNEENP